MQGNREIMVEERLASYVQNEKVEVEMFKNKIKEMTALHPFHLFLFIFFFCQSVFLITSLLSWV